MRNNRMLLLWHFWSFIPYIQYKSWYFLYILNDLDTFSKRVCKTTCNIFSSFNYYELIIFPSLYFILKIFFLMCNIYKKQRVTFARKWSYHTYSSGGQGIAPSVEPIASLWTPSAVRSDPETLTDKMAC